MFMALPFWIVLGTAAYFGRKFGLKVFERTESRLLGFATFVLILIAPWIDAVPGAIYYSHWKRTHPAYAAYGRPKVDGFLYEGGVAIGLPASPREFLPSPVAPYQFIEFRRERLPRIEALDGPGNYIQLSHVPADGANCLTTPTPVFLGYSSTSEAIRSSKPYCIVATFSTRPRSEYQLNGKGRCPEGEWKGSVAEGSLVQQVGKSDLFPVYGDCQQIRHIATGRVIAEVWHGTYRPYLAQKATIWPFWYRFKQYVGWPDPEKVTQVLQPKHPVTFE